MPTMANANQALVVTAPIEVDVNREWASPLGPRGEWPQTLRGLVDVMAASLLPSVLLWGRSDPLTALNPACRALAGMSDEVPPGHPEDAWPDRGDQLGAILDSIFAGQPSVTRDCCVKVRRNGGFEEIQVDCFYTPVRDDTGAVAGALGLVVDRTAEVFALRHQAESASRLSESETRLGMLVNQASVGITQSDLSGRLTTANDRFCDIVGRPANDVVGAAIETLVHTDDRAAMPSTMAALVAGGGPLMVEERLVRPDGRVVWVSNHMSLAHDPQGRPDFVIRIYQDITARKQAEALARQSIERIQLALGAGAIVGAWIWDVKTRTLSGDDRFAALLSIDPERAATGVPVAVAFRLLHPQDRENAEDSFDAAVRNGGYYRAEYRLQLGDGRWLWLEANGHCEFDSNGSPARIPGILIDIDQRRTAVERSTFLIELGDQLRTIDNPEAVMSSTAEATARYLHANDVGYGEVSPDGAAIHLLGGWALTSKPLVGRYPAAILGSDAVLRLQAGEPSMANAGSIADLAEGDLFRDRALLAVPLFREGRWQAVMFASDGPDRAWTQSDADVLREVVGRTWDAVERARAVITLRKAQGRQAFLLRLNDHLSELHDPLEVVETVVESLGTYLNANGAGYGEVNPDDKTISFDRVWSDRRVTIGSGVVRYAGRFEDDVAELARGLTVSEDDYGSRATLSPALRGLLEETGIRSSLAVPLIRDGRFRAGIFLGQATPRRWSLEEISLTQEVARRTWDALERTRAEQALQRSEARLRAMFDTLPVGIVFAEMPSGQVTEGNSRVEEILGYSVLAAPDSPAYGEWVAFDEDGRRVPIEEHPLYMAITTGEIVTRVFHHQRGDGARVWISVVGAPVLDVEGRITGGLITIVDIDREKRAEEALRELNATLEQQVELRTRERDRVWQNSHDLFVVIGVDGMVRDVNPSWTALLGWPPDALMGHRFETFIHPDDIAGTGEALEALKGRPLATPFENRYRTSTGSYRWFSWTATLEEDAIYANGRDVTAEREQAEALRQAEEQLRQSQKMEAVGQLTGGIAHDFNNLLTGITGALDLLSKRISQGRMENTGRYIEMAMSSANRAASLTHRLLAFSRRQPLEAQPVDANRLVGSMDDLLRRTLGEKITLEVAVETGLWLTLCDPHQLENALLNLVINARDAMPDGGRLTIRTGNISLDDVAAAREAGVKPGRYVMLAVSDTGTGMAADVIARAFDPFFTTKPIGQGTGLGLSMIYGFARQSEGMVKITSEVGVGTTVKLFLPRFRGELVDAGEGRTEPPRAQANETVLVVEDDATVRELVLEVLRDLGYRALEADDGPTGLTVLESSEHIDLLVTDVGLPGLNGRQLADRARQIRPDLKVLFITGYAENATFGGGILDPGMQMITKPFVVEVFATKIKEMIEAA